MFFENYLLCPLPILRMILCKEVLDKSITERKIWTQKSGYDSRNSLAGAREC